MFCIFSTDKHLLKAYILINLGANRVYFIDFRFAHLYGFSLIFIEKSRRLYGFDE